MAPAVLHLSAARPRRSAAWRASSPLFPLMSWLRSRRWPVSYRHIVLCPWLVGRSPNCARRRWPAALLPISVAPRSGAGSARTRYAPGAIGVGSFHVTRTSPARLGQSSICISVAGKVQHWGRVITCSALMRRPAFRQGGANIGRCPRHQGGRIHVEHEYVRAGASAYLAAWDVHRARLFGRCERKNSIAAFHRLVGQVMGREPYRSARRVFLIADNGSCHRGRHAADRLRTRWQNIVLVHTPIHASWLNQIEVYFWVVQRKLLTPERLQGPGQPEAERDGLPGSLPTGRQAVLVDLHAPRSARTSLANSKKRRAHARKFRDRNTSPYCAI